MRRLIPRLIVALAVVASLLATAPWLRAFPADVGAAALLGAAVLSVLIPTLSQRFGARLWLSALIDFGGFVVFTLTVVLHDPFAFATMLDGIYRGPSQILTFALPLVSPLSLLVAPVALTWLAGALAGECVARRWTSVIAYVGLLMSFGLAYAGTQRAAGSDGAAAQLRETVLAAALLATLLLLRSSQAWVRADETAEVTEPDGVLPLRGFAVGVVTTAVVALAASLIVQANAFPKRATTPQRVPSIDDSRPLGPVSFIAGLRPRDRTLPAQPVFTVTLGRAAPGYFAIANLDVYDGAGWSFERTFRPSGGVLPDDVDPALHTAGPSVVQTFRIATGPLSSAPWMPTLYRPKRVTGTAVDIDQGSGMIVPAARLASGAGYTVESAVARRTFAQLTAASATPDTATPTVDSQLPGLLRTTLDRLVTEFAAETGVPSTPALPFLQALQQNLRSKYVLSGAARGSSTGTQSATPGEALPASRPAAGSSSRPSRARPPTSSAVRASPSASGTGVSSDRAGGTGFADVLASVLGQRSGTPEQFATLVALVARELGVPARVVTGFRATSDSGVVTLAAGNYTVDTSEAWTWVEIPIVDAGWLVLDAAPGRYSDRARQPESGAASSPSASALPSQRALITSAAGGHAVARRSDVPETGSSSGQGLLVALLIASGVLALALLLVLGSRKRVRAARRRRAKDPRAQLLGAWQESIDMLAEAGLPELATSTSEEIARLAGEQFGALPGEQAAALGRSANAVAYRAATVIHPPDVERAWAAHRVLRRTVGRQLGWRGRMSAAMRYHRANAVARPVGPASWAAAAGAPVRGLPGKRRYHGWRRQ